MSTNTSSSNPQYFRADQARFPRDLSARDSASSGRLQSREREIKALKDEIEKLRENEERSHAKIKALERKIEELETQKRILEEQLDMVRKRVDALEEVQVSLLLATMCDEIQNMMFKRIFPQRFNPKVQRKVKDIEDMLRTSGDREKRLWASLQAELNWKYCHIDAVKSLKRVRKKRAHPEEKLTEEALRVSVQKMTEHFFEEGDGRLSVRVVNELISMWKQLKEKH